MAGEFRLVISAHALAECFSVLTRLPGTLKCSPTMAQAVLKGNLLTRAKALVVALEVDDFDASIGQPFWEMGFVGKQQDG